jgi:hypothetical protein
MDYELAKQLKDAGFPQEGDRPGDMVSGGDVLGERVYYPTLSELIEACGMDFGDLKRMVNGRFGARNSNITLSILGDTPEEAVANLWLALNSPKANLT